MSACKHSYVKWKYSSFYTVIVRKRLDVQECMLIKAKAQCRFYYCMYERRAMSEQSGKVETNANRRLNGKRSEEGLLKQAFSILLCLQ